MTKLEDEAKRYILEAEERVAPPTPRERDIEEAKVTAAIAQAKATLALVEQTRIQTCVMLSNMEFKVPGGGIVQINGIFDEDWHLDKDVAKALGLYPRDEQKEPL